MPWNGSPRSAGEESAVRLVVRAAIAVVDVAVACLPYAVAAAAAAAGSAGRRLRHPVGDDTVRCALAEQRRPW